jgi:hypothetical protein
MGAILSGLCDRRMTRAVRTADGQPRKQKSRLTQVGGFFDKAGSKLPAVKRY